MIELRRMWINQPSTSQPYHYLHGTRVLAAPPNAFTAQIFFLWGDTVSQEGFPEIALSPGWPRLPEVEIAVADGVAIVGGNDWPPPPLETSERRITGWVSTAIFAVLIVALIVAVFA
jgi:hypothetical protein